MVESSEAYMLSPTTNQGILRPARKYSSADFWRLLK